jgi:hypothetical protein
VPWGLRPAVCACAVVVLLGLTAWFGAEVVTGAGQAGLAERIVGAAQALWLLTVVLSCCLPPRVISGSTAYARPSPRYMRPGRTYRTSGGPFG